MNTRHKIVPLEQAEQIAATRPTRWLTGYFDPLLAEHARKAAGLAAPDFLVIAVVIDPPEQLLPRRSRAELVAALAAVDYVVMEETASAGPPFDAEIVSGLIHRVVERHHGQRTP